MSWSGLGPIAGRQRACFFYANWATTMEWAFRRVVSWGWKYARAAIRREEEHSGAHDR